MGVHFIGVDPDLHNTGIAAITQHGDICGVKTVTVAADLKGQQAAVEMCMGVTHQVREWMLDLPGISYAAVEFPVVYAGKERAKEAVCLLDLVAGAAMGAMSHGGWFLKPQEWKGQQKKEAHQKRILERAGAGFGGCTSHEIDALGLAFWGLDRWTELEKRKEYSA